MRDLLPLLAGDEVFENLDPHLRERMLANGETFFGLEMGAFEPYRPDVAALAAIEVPVRVMVGNESTAFFAEVARRSHECRVGGATRRSHALLRPSGRDGRDAKTPSQRTFQTTHLGRPIRQ
jgi:hypothetical protein